MPTPSTSTAVDDSLPVPVLAVPASVSYSLRRTRKSTRFESLAVHWARLKRRVGTGTAPSSSSVVGDSAAGCSYTRQMEALSDTEEVDEVVVDRLWSEEIKTSFSLSENAPTPEKSGSSHHINSDYESLHHDGSRNPSSHLVILWWQTWPRIVKFFGSGFVDQSSEQHYAQENWFMKKSLAVWASLWIILNWVLGCIFAAPLRLPFDRAFYFGFAPLFSLPIFIMIMYDWPRDRSNIYQTALTISIWSSPFYSVLSMYLCGFYANRPSYWDCQHRDFLGLFYYATALQAIGLFGLKLNRLPAVIGASLFFIITCSLMIPFRKTWAHNMINFLFFHLFLIYIHYMRESSERRLYTLRDQLKIQFKATQKAQINERKAADSKRRLTSYVFHEVRVPLNTALLAVQNMDASGTVAKEQEIEFNALEGSLSMMSKVLNDVLDFNRMDSGRFESAYRPYAFHQVMRSMFIPLRLATDARRLELVTELDPAIDQIARRAAYEAMGENADAIASHISEHPNVDGVVIGDESRLRQIITNLTSNACKFTPAGGKLIISTRLVMSSAHSGLDHSALEPKLSRDEKGPPPLSTNLLTRHNQDDKPVPPLEWIVVRIEVSDTGCGIKPLDMAHNKLFSAFNQTEQGRTQGGKGTGLGLALVRSIVKLSGGRLGVRSKAGEGSTFWVELPLVVGRKTLISSGPVESDRTSQHSATDLEKVLAAAETTASVPVSMNSSLIMAVDAAALKASQVPTVSSRSSAAMHSLMEQGGRVELFFERHSPILTTSTDDSCAIEGMPPRQPLTEASSSETTKQLRPTYLHLPSPRSFEMDLHPTATSHRSSMSNQSISPLAAFDSSYTRGSPTTPSPSMNFEQGLPVLVVDDDPLTRTLMKRILTRLGCSVSTAENGEMALEMILGTRFQHATTPASDASGKLGPILERQSEFIDENRYAVVFLDNQMPVMSGLKAVEKLRQIGRKDLIVGVTGNALLTDQKEYLDAGVDRVLTKPVLERSLRDILVLADERRKRLGDTSLPN